MSDKIETPTDWEEVQELYRVGVASLRAIAAQHNCTEGAIRKRAKKGQWVRASLTDPATTPARVDDKSRPGFVYVLRLIDTAGMTFYKIGMALDAEQRQMSHQGSSPFSLEIAVSYYVGNMRREESMLHAMFDAYRVRGEWFAFSSDNLNTIALRARLV